MMLDAQDDMDRLGFHDPSQRANTLCKVSQAYTHEDSQIAFILGLEDASDVIQEIAREQEQRMAANNNIACTKSNDELRANHQNRAWKQPSCAPHGSSGSATDRKHPSVASDTHAKGGNTTPALVTLNTLSDIPRMPKEPNGIVAKSA
jgi:hypothetical protein